MAFLAHLPTGPDHAVKLPHPRRYPWLAPVLFAIIIAIRTVATSRFTQPGFWAGVAGALGLLFIGIAGFLGRKPPGKTRH
jgi:hypothetical protein